MPDITGAGLIPPLDPGAAFQRQLCHNTSLLFLLTNCFLCFYRYASSLSVSVTFFVASPSKGPSAVPKCSASLNFVTASGRGACERLRCHAVELAREPQACRRAGSSVWKGSCRHTRHELIGVCEIFRYRSSSVLCGGRARRELPGTFGSLEARSV